MKSNFRCAMFCLAFLLHRSCAVHRCGCAMYEAIGPFLCFGAEIREGFGLEGALITTETH